MFHLNTDGSLVQIHEEVLANPELAYHLNTERERFKIKRQADIKRRKKLIINSSRWTGRLH